MFKIVFTGLFLLVFSSYVRPAKTKRELEGTDFSFYKNKVYVYEGLLSGHLCRKIKKGLYIKYAITDSAKLQDRVQFWDIKEFTAIEGKYVNVLGIEKSRPDSTYYPLLLRGELNYAK